MKFLWLFLLQKLLLASASLKVLAGDADEVDWTNSTDNSTHRQGDGDHGDCPVSLPPLDLTSWDICHYNDESIIARDGCRVPGPPSEVKAPVESPLPGQLSYWSITLSWTPPSVNADTALGYRVNISCWTRNERDVLVVQIVDMAMNKTYITLNTRRPVQQNAMHWAPNGFTSPDMIMPRERRQCAVKVTSLPIKSMIQQTKEVDYELSSCRDMDCPSKPTLIFSGCLDDGYSDERRLCNCVPLAPSNVTATYHGNGNLLISWSHTVDGHVKVVKYGIACFAVNVSARPRHCFPNGHVLTVPPNATEVLVNNARVKLGYTYSLLVWGLSRSSDDDLAGELTSGDLSKPFLFTVHEEDVTREKEKQRSYVLLSVLGAVSGVLIILVMTTVYCVRQRRLNTFRWRYSQGVEMDTIADNPGMSRCLQEQRLYLLNSLDHKAVVDFWRTRKVIPRTVLREYELVCHEQSLVDSRRKFIELLLSRPADEYDMFLDALDETGQMSLASVLRRSPCSCQVDRGTTTEPVLSENSVATAVPSNPGQSSVQVYVSYSRWPPSMQETVRHLAVALRCHGINAVLDQFHSLECSDSPVEWMAEKMSLSNFVIVVLSEFYPLCLPKEERIPVMHHINELHLSAVEADILQGEILEGRRNFILPVCIGMSPAALSVPDVFKHRTIYFLDAQYSNNDWERLIYRLFDVEMFSDGNT